VRDILRQSVSPSEGILVIEKVSEYIAKRYGLSPRSFEARLLEGDDIFDAQTAKNILPFARLTAQALRQWGGEEFERVAQQLENQATKQEWLQRLSFEFETVFVNKRGKIIQTQQCQAYYYEEPLGEDSEPLKMISIPEGEFLMGSPEGEKDQYDDEKPQHQVTVSPFFMSQTPITQAQWRFVANLPQEQRELNPNPSRVEKNNNPVERVSWYDAMEFCARLSSHTRRDYRLPSEAEWEYACRAIQNSKFKIQNESAKIQNPSYPPFHYGETITGKLANYNATETYADEPKEEYREKTTPVRSFKPNAFGLYDMHGNVWEWCLDHWHENYQDAPSDGRVWDERNKNNNHYQKILEAPETFLKDKRSRIFRGGSWYDGPEYCRSAFRTYNNPVNGNDNIGFRVACGLPRTF
ncbi:MAG: SUMF1/EgtB/PvdO family nonheme iron enzyme, partial [Microcystaceae cyanobacterium]